MTKKWHKKRWKFRGAKKCQKRFIYVWPLKKKFWPGTQKKRIFSLIFSLFSWNSEIIEKCQKKTIFIRWSHLDRTHLVKRGSKNSKIAKKWQKMTKKTSKKVQNFGGKFPKKRSQKWKKVSKVSNFWGVPGHPAKGGWTPLYLGVRVLNYMILPLIWLSGKNVKFYSKMTKLRFSKTWHFFHKSENFSKISYF